MSVLGRFGSISVLLVGLMALAVGCGGGGSDTGSTGGETTSAETTSEAGPKPTGKPVVIYDVSDEDLPGTNFGRVREGAEAAADYVNEELGGIAGRPVKLVVCNPHIEPAKTAACANEAVEQEAAAVIGVGLVWGEAGLPITAKAGIPTLTVPISGPELTDPTSTPLTGGAFVNARVSGRFIAEEGGSTIAHVGNDVAVNHEISTFLKEGLELGGASDAKVEEVFTKLEAPDLSPAMVKAVQSDPDFIFLDYGQSDLVRSMKALAQLGWPPEKVITTDVGTDKEEFLEPSGAEDDGIYLVSAVYSPDNTENEEVATFQEQMQKQIGKPGVSVYNQYGFADVMAVYEAGKEAGSDFGAEDVLKTLSTAEGFPVFMGRELCSKCAPKQYPAIRQVYDLVLQWKDGELVEASDWISAE